MAPKQSRLLYGYLPINAVTIDGDQLVEQVLALVSQERRLHRTADGTAPFCHLQQPDGCHARGSEFVWEASDAPAERLRAVVECNNSE